MSSIAQKLCNEIVNPTNLKSNDQKTTEVKSSDLETSDQKSYSTESSNYSKSTSRPSIASNRSRYSGRPTRTIVIKKEKEINKIVPQGPNKAVSINKFKSKETLLKKNFVDTACNTAQSGPLRSDTDCITVVRAREKCCTNAGTRSCACKHKPIPKCVTHTRQIQTANPTAYRLTENKACTQCVETASFGTVTPFGNFSDNTTPRYTTPLSSIYKNRDSRTSQNSDPIPRPNNRGTRLSFLEPDDRFDQPRQPYKPRQYFEDSHHHGSCHHKEYGYDKEYEFSSRERDCSPKSRPDLYQSSYTKTTFGSCNRWAIAQHPARGPDF